MDLPARRQCMQTINDGFRQTKEIEIKWVRVTIRWEISSRLTSSSSSPANEPEAESFIFGFERRFSLVFCCPNSLLDWRLWCIFILNCIVFLQPDWRWIEFCLISPEMSERLVKHHWIEGRNFSMVRSKRISCNSHMSHEERLSLIDAHNALRSDRLTGSSTRKIGIGSGVGTHCSSLIVSDVNWINRSWKTLG